MATQSTTQQSEAFELVAEHDIRNVHGAPGFFELATPDPDAAARFLAEAFGWEVARTDSADGEYWIGLVRGHSVGGIRRSTTDDPTGPTWMNYVTVEDVDVAVEAATAAGGSVVVPPSPVGEVGRMAMVEGPGVGRMLAMEYRRPFA